jgi:hypothetical protein
MNFRQKEICNKKFVKFVLPVFILKYVIAKLFYNPSLAEIKPEYKTGFISVQIL